MPPPADELRRLVDSGYSVDDILAHYGRSHSTVYRWFHALGVEPPPRSSWARTISAERLRELYGTPLTYEQIAEREGVTKGQVERAMHYHQVEARRAPSWAQQARERPPAAELRRVYREKGSVRRVADHYEVNVRKAHEWLSDPEVDVQRRPPGRPRSRSPSEWNDT